jgi:hypothetical protein
MRRVLNNPALESQFHQDGFVTLRLLTVSQVADLTTLINDLNDQHREQSVEDNSSYKLSYFNDDIDFKKKVYDALWAFFKPFTDQHLYNYKPIIVNIFDKEPGKGEVPIHQNWSFVDEDYSTSVSVWIPLVKVSRANGTLEVVKGSHKVLSKYRSPSIPWVFDELNEVLKEKYLQPFELVPGEVAIIDDGILHWSSDNKTDKVRTAVQLIMVPNDVPTIHYVKADHNAIDVLQVDEIFFMHYSNMRDVPRGYPIIGRKEIHQKKLNEKEFREIVARNNQEILEMR